MRKGFTMIELIFVIVILGILAAVAIPRLSATRDDAEVSKAATNLNTAISDIASFYAAKGDFKAGGTAIKIAEMTGVPLYTTTKGTITTDANGHLFVKDTACVKFTAVDSATDGTPAHIIIELIGGTDATCKMVSANPGVASALKSKFTYVKVTTSGTGTTSTDTTLGDGQGTKGYIRVGGTGVRY